MKRIPVLPLLLTLLLALTACGSTAEEPAPAADPQTAETQTKDQAEAPADQAEDPSLARLRTEIETTGNLVGAAFLGGLSEGGQAAYDELIAEYYLDAWPFLADLDWEQAAVASGMEVYCVVPRDRDSSVTVTEWVMDEGNDFRGEAGRVLYESDAGDPVLLMGNVSDILPNLRVTVTAPDGQTLSWSPCLSLRDGTLDRSAVEGVYDFSVYPDLPPEGIPDYSGDWAAASVADGSGAPCTCCLGLVKDGAVDFFYYREPGVILARFTGTARDNPDEGTVTLDLYLTGGTLLEEGAQAYTTIGSYRMELADEDTLFLTHLDGDPLLFGLEGKTVTFTRAMG